MDGNNSSWKQMSIASTSPTLKTQAPLGQHYSNFTLSMIVINALMAFMATSLNLLIIVTFVKTTSLRETPSNVLVLGLAISDLFVGVFEQPLFCVAWICWSYRAILIIVQQAIWKVYSIHLLSYYLLLSLFTLTAITVDRFLAVKLHLRYQELVTTKRYGITLACIWIISIFAVIRDVFIKETAAFFIIVLTILCCTIFINIYLLFKISQVIHRHSRTDTSPTAINTTVHRHA